MKKCKFFLYFFGISFVIIPCFISAFDVQQEEKIRNIVRFANDSNFVRKLLERYADSRRERRHLLIDSIVYVNKYKQSFTNHRIKINNLKKLDKEFRQGFFERYPLLAGLASFGIVKYGLEYFILKWKGEETTFKLLPALLAIYVFIKCSP